MRHLLGFAALAAAMAMAPAAQAFSPIQVNVGGFFTGVGGWLDKHGAVEEDDVQAGSDAAVNFRAETTLDNGIEVGISATWFAQDDCTVSDSVPVPPPSASCVKDAVNLAYLDLSTGLGRLRLGQQRSVNDLLMMRTPTPLDEVSADNAELDALGLANVNSELDDSGHGARILYSTPRLFGVQAGVSYLWDFGRDGPLVTLVPDPLHPNSNGRTAFAAAVNFEHDIKDIVLRGAFAYYMDNRIDGAADPIGYNLGLQVGVAGFTLGGNYTWGDNMDHRTTYLDDSQTNIWSAGLTWGNGPWAVGLNYADGQDKLAGISGDFSSVVGGLSYEFNRNIKVGLGYQHDKADPTTGADAKGDAVFVETGLKF